MLGKHCTTKLHPRPQPFILNRNFSLASWRQLVFETVSGKKCITNRASGRAELVRQTNKQTWLADLIVKMKTRSLLSFSFSLSSRPGISDLSST
jgi:hypothetical protein